MAHGSDAIRNIALIGHGNSGKTSLVETLLVEAGRIPTAGTITRGSTVCDFDPLEKTHQHSLQAALVSIDTAGVHINLVDTPGFPEFIGHALAGLSAVETAAVVINAESGIENVTSRLMQQASERRLCRMLVVNKIDAAEVNFEALVGELQEAFGSECLPINLPSNDGAAVVDCFAASSADVVTDFSSVSEAHTAIIDQVIELDEELMEAYLEEGVEITPDRLHDTFERALREGHLIPICFVSAETGAGVRELLDVFAKLAPSPLEGNPQPFFSADGSPFSPDPASEDGHAIAHVFKITIDPFVGKLAHFRIHQGRVSKDTQLFIGEARKPFKVGHLLCVFGKETHEVESGIAGDICAVAKIDDIHRDVVLHDSHDEDEIRITPPSYPSPLFGLAITVKKRGDVQKLSEALHKLVEEDPGLTVEHNQATGQTVLRGLSDLHMRIAMEKMAERFKLEVHTEPPKIAYRESITVAAGGHHRHKKQTGGAGQFGEVSLRIEPLEQGSGFEFKSEVVGGNIPTSLLPAVEKGVKDALSAGAIAGFPLHDIRAVAIDGKHHPVDSKEVAFVTAGREAFFDAVRKAKPKILEPVVIVHVQAPADAMGAISGDLASRRGRMNGSNVAAGGNILIEGQVPLAELANYQSQLTSITGGAGTYDITFSHYEPVPDEVQQRLVSEYHSEHHAPA